MRPKRSAIQADHVRDGKRRSHPGDLQPIPPVFPVCFQSQKLDFVPSPINDRFRFAETWPG